MKSAARCLTRQRRACHGAWDWCTIAPEDQLRGPQPVDDSCPKWPFSVRDPFPEKTVGGRPYVTPADQADWDKKFRAWYEEKKADPEYTFVDANEEAIVRQPYHHPDEHAKFLEDFKSMPAEERRRLGHTVNEERKKPFHELFPKDWEELEEAAIYLSRDDAKLDRYYRYNNAVVLHFKNGQPATQDRSVRACWTDAVPDYMGDLREALSKRSDKEAEAAAAGEKAA